MIVIGSLLILISPLAMAFAITKYCWQRGWTGRIVWLMCVMLFSLHTHAHYFPSTSLKERYANALLKNQTDN